MLQLEQTLVEYQGTFGDYTYRLVCTDKGVVVYSHRTDVGSFGAPSSVEVLHPTGDFTPLLATLHIPHFSTKGEAVTAIQTWEATY